MEMMVVLTIVAIVAAASAPMVNRKMVRTAAGAGSPWEWVNGIPGNSIFYNHEGNDNQNAAIGRELAPNGGSNSLNANNARLYVDIQNDTTPHIAFGNNGTNVLKLLAGGSRNSIVFSDNISTDGMNRSVVIGPGATASNHAQVVIGSGARSGHVRAVAIGNDAQVSREESIAIGSGARAEGGAYSTAVGFNSVSSSTRATALGSYASATAAGAIAIGANSPTGANQRTQATGTNTIAIGTNAFAFRPDSIAIGRGAAVSPDNAGGTNSIAIGRGARTNQDDTVVIGRSANSVALGAISLGVSSSASSNAIALGTPSTNGAITNAGGANSIAIGRGAQATRVNSVAIGNGTTSSANNAIVIGIDAVSNPSNMTIPAGTTKTIVLGDANTRVIVPGILVPNNLEISNLAVRGNLNVLNELRVGGRTYTGFNMYGYKKKHAGNWKGDTSLIVGMYSKDDHNNKWVHPGGNGGHAYWQFSGLTRQENSHDMKAVNADRYDDETQVWKDGTIQTVTRNAFTDFYNVFGLAHPGFSDRRLKNVGKEFAAGLAELKKLDLYHYTYKEDEYKTPHVGVMAQDLQKIFPDAVRKGEDGFLRIRMEDMFYAVINAVKELDSRVSLLEQQQKRIDELEKRLADLEKKVK